MKKTLLILFLVLASAVYAQSPKWGCGDTVHGQNAPDTTYFYQWWCDTLGPRYNTTLIFEPFSLRDDNWVVRYNYTDRMVDIYGLAACMFCPWGEYDLPEYLLLFDATPDSFPLKAQVEIDLSDTHRYLRLDCRTPNNSCCDNCMDNSVTYPLYEYYFEKPVTVHDSFYVGATNYNFTQHDQQSSGAYRLMYYGWIQRMQPTESTPPSCTIDCPHIPYQYYRVLTRNGDTLFTHPYANQPVTAYNMNLTIYGYSFLTVFPLLKPDTQSFTCHNVSGIRIIDRNDTACQLAWNSYSGQTAWEVVLCPEGTPPDTSNAILCTSPTCTIEGFDHTQSWIVYIRAICEYRRVTYYTTWSGIEIYHYTPNHDDESIDTPDEEDNRFVTLMPNPAHREVQIVSGYKIKKLELVDGLGRIVATQQADGHSALFDIEGMPKGIYVMLVHTDMGITTRRLVVE